MANLGSYDANQWEPNVGFEPVPAGDYTAVITESEWQPTKKGDGKFLKLTVQIVEGPAEGRKLFDRLNLENRNAQAVEIAKRTLSAICRAVGKMTPSDSMELHNIPLSIKVAVKNREDTGEPANEIKAYKAVNGAPPAVPSKPTPGVKPKAPWEKK